MTTEIINIQIREDGSRVVSRNIEGIGTAAQRASNPVSQLKSLLASIAAGAAIAEIARLADEYTNLQNRLRLVTDGAGNLARINKELLTISNQTRSDLVATNELYFRLASNTKELGLSQQELLGFTKSVNQAIILSGASSAEAAGGLRQLAQGIASNTLRGEELNSVLENLPKVAEIIRNGMGLTIGEMRKVAAEGKITARDIVDAFKKAGKDLETQFGTTVPTIGQSFTVLKNNLLVFIGETDQAYGISAKLSRAILFLADNLDELANAFVVITKVTASATAGYLIYEASIKAGALVTAARQAIAYHTAIARGTIVVLGSAEAERQRAVYALESARAAQAATAAQVESSLAEARATAAATQSKVANVAATQAAIVAAREDALAKLASSNASIVQAKRTIAATEAVGALSYALALNKAATLDLAAAEAARSAAMTELAVLGQQQARVSVLTTEALAAQTAAQNALTAAQTRGAAATQAAAAATAQASTTAAAATAAAAGSTSLLGQAVARLRIAFSGLFAFIAANPIGIFIAIVGAAIVAIIAFRDQIKLGVDETTTLGDVMRAAWELVVPAIKAAADAAAEFFGWITGASFTTFNAMLDHILGYQHENEATWLKLVRIVVQVFDMIGGVIRGTMAGVQAVIIKVIAAIMNNFEQLGNAFTAAANFDGEALLAAVKSNIAGYKAAGTDIGATFGEAFAREQLNQADNGLEAGMDALIKRAQEISKERNASQKVAEGALLPGGPGSKVSSPVDDKAAKRAARELEKLKNELAQILDQADPVAAAKRRIAEAEDTLTRAVQKGLITQQDANKALENLKFQLRDQLDPLGAVNRELEERASLLKMNSEQSKVESDLMRITQQLQRDGVVLTKEETDQLRAKLVVEQELARIAQVRDQLEADSQRRKSRNFTDQVTASQQLMNDPSSGFTQNDAFNAANSSMNGLFNNSQQYLESQLLQQQEYYAQVQALRDADIINEQTAAAARAQIWSDTQALQLNQAATFFGSLAQLQKSENKKIAAIGKAAAIAQTIINTYQSATSAYAAMAGIPYVGPFLGAAAAAAAVVAGMANVQAIRSQQPGFRTGGSMVIGGSGGADSQMVSFRGTPGEVVSVHTPAQARAIEKLGEGQQQAQPRRVQNVTQNIIIQGRPDKRTPDQYARAASRQARREYERS